MSDCLQYFQLGIIEKLFEINKKPHGPLHSVEVPCTVEIEKFCFRVKSSSLDRPTDGFRFKFLGSKETFSRISGQWFHSHESGADEVLLKRSMGARRPSNPPRTRDVENDSGPPCSAHRYTYLVPPSVPPLLRPLTQTFPFSQRTLCQSKIFAQVSQELLTNNQATWLHTVGTFSAASSHVPAD